MKLAVNTAKLLRNVPLPDEIATVHDSAVVVDLGSGTIKAGFSGDDAPRHVVPCVVGTHPRSNAGVTNPQKDGGKEMYVCSQAYKLRETLELAPPIRNGLVQDWGDPLNVKDRNEGPVEKIFTHIYEDLLRTSLSDANQPLLLSTPVLTDLTPAKENREKLCEILFEGLNIPSLYFSPSPVLSLYSSGRTTGVVVEMGYSTCSAAPVFEGLHLFHSILQLDFAGLALTDMVVKMLAEGGSRFPQCHERHIGAFVKETLCQVAEDKAAYEQAVANQSDVRKYTLPDGTEVALGPQRWNVAECLFTPSLLNTFEGDTARGIQLHTLDAVRKCDTDIAPSLLQNVVLAGGTSMLHGMPERLDTELSELNPHDKVKVHAATERSHATWIGGSILASLPTFQDLWVSRADYDEYGQSHPGLKRQIINRNCF